MTSRLWLYLLMGLFLFIFQELFLIPRIYLRPLAPLLFYLALKESLIPGASLALLVGLLLDSYALTPFGLHLMGALILVAAIRVLRQRFLLKTPWSLIITMLLALILQETVIRLVLALLGVQNPFRGNLALPLVLELFFTALLCPAFFGLFRALENWWGGISRSVSRAEISW